MDEGDMRTLKVAQDQLHRAVIANLVQRERLARDNGRWEEMAAYYHPEATIDVSWFQGSGAEFVASTVKQANKRIASSNAVASVGLAPRDDLPGEDRPGTVAASLTGKQHWLEEG